MLSRHSLIPMAIAIAMGCHTEDMPGPVDVIPPMAVGENILFVIADDMGKDATNGFPEGFAKATTPNLDDIANRGLTFTNLWVNPSCAPTRASIITGKYGFRTGVAWSGRTLPASEEVLQDYISNQTNHAIATAVIGKWHLSGTSGFNPESLGIDHFAGILGAGVADYYNWQFTEDGVTSTNTGYVTEVLTDRAIEWIEQQDDSWFMWLAYNAPHAPFHEAPSGMHSQGALPEYSNGMDASRHYMAAIEAMDFQIGRLLGSMSPDERSNTTIIFLGDNGTPPRVAQAPYGNATSKGSLYQGGINTPMFVSGNRVGRTGLDDSLINGTDLYATIAALAGVNVTEVHDSRSFLPLLTTAGTHRDVQYSEIDDGSRDVWTLREQRYKLIENADGDEEMYDLLSDPYETNDLLRGTLKSDQTAVRVSLKAQADSIRGG